MKKIFLVVVFLVVFLNSEVVLGEVSSERELLFDKALSYENAGNYNQALQYWHEFIKECGEDLSKKKIQDIKNHIIICKYEKIIDEFKKHGKGNYSDVYFAQKGLKLIYLTMGEKGKSLKKKEEMEKLEKKYPALKISPPKVLSKSKDTNRVMRKKEPGGSWEEKKVYKNFIRTKNSKAVVLNRTIDFFDNEGNKKKTMNFGGLIKTVPSRNGKYIAVSPLPLDLPSEWREEYEKTIDKSAEFKDFVGVIDTEGNVVWSTDKITTIDKVSDNGEVAISVPSFLFVKKQNSIFICSKDDVVKIQPFGKENFAYEWGERSFDISHDGKHILLSLYKPGNSQEGGEVILYTNTGQETWRYKGKGKSSPVGVISPSGKYVAIMDARTIYLYSAARRYLVWQKKVNRGGRLYFSDNEKYLLLGGSNHISTYFIQNSSLFWKYEDENSLIKFVDISISGDGNFIVASAVIKKSGKHPRYAYLFTNKGKVIWKKQFPEKDYYTSWSDGVKIHITDDGKEITVVTPSKIYNYKN